MLNSSEARADRQPPLYLQDLVEADDPLPLLQTREGDRAAATDRVDYGSHGVVLPVAGHAGR